MESAFRRLQFRKDIFQTSRRRRAEYDFVRALGDTSCRPGHYQRACVFDVPLRPSRRARPFRMADSQKERSHYERLQGKTFPDVSEFRRLVYSGRVHVRYPLYLADAVRYDFDGEIL